MASTIKQNNFELEPVFKQLFKSEHFFDTNNNNILIKSPIDMMIGLHLQLSFSYDDNTDLPLQLRNSVGIWDKTFSLL